MQVKKQHFLNMHSTFFKKNYLEKNFAFFLKKMIVFQIKKSWQIFCRMHIKSYSLTQAKLIFGRTFLTVSTKWLDSPMTSKTASFGQDKKTMQKPVTNTYSSFQSECVKTPSSTKTRLFASNLLFWNWKETNLDVQKSKFSWNPIFKSIETRKISRWMSCLKKTSPLQTHFFQTETRFERHSKKSLPHVSAQSK